MARVEEELNKASSRRWLYGVNVALLVIVSIVILGFLLVLTNKYRYRKDMTSAGLYSLSGSTKNLLQRVDEKSDQYTLINLVPDSRIVEQAEKHQQVMDELEEYARWSKNLKVEDGSGETRDVLEKRIRDIYAAELKPYEETIGEFDKMASDVEKFLKEEGANIGAAAQKPGTPAIAVRQAAQIQGQFTGQLPELVAAVRPGIRRAMESPLPRWSSIQGDVKNLLDQFIKLLEPLSNPDAMKGEVDPALLDYFKDAAPRYKATAEKIKAYRDRIDKLPALKVDSVLNALTTNTVLVLGPTSARVVSENELFTMGPPMGASQTPTTTFNGEQAISSALLAMIQPEKVKVVFVSAAPMQLTTMLYSRAADMLREANFDVLEWSPPGAPMGPDQPPQGEPNPPAEGRGVVWIVFPPAAPNQQMMMMGMMPPNPQPVIDAARRHMAAGGQALFMADAAGNSMMPGPTGYPYQELLNDFGIEVQTKYAVVRQIERPDPEGGGTFRRVLPVVQIDQFGSHEITRPLASLPTIVAAMQSRTGFVGMPTMVSIRSADNAEAAVLFSTPKSSDYWGESELKADASFDKTQDAGSPVPLAAAARRFKGQKDKEQRVVVLGSSMIASNSILDEAQPVLVGNRIRSEPMFPGNAELLRNSVLWLSGYENMIAVSSKASVALRISDIPPATLTGIRWGILWIGAPLAALVMGGIVWFWRRR